MGAWYCKGVQWQLGGLHESYQRSIVLKPTTHDTKSTRGRKGRSSRENKYYVNVQVNGVNELTWMEQHSEVDRTNSDIQ
jgi:hypothetical protein